MRNWLLRILDRLVLISCAFRVRRDRVELLSRRIDDLREDHRRELAVRDSEIALLKREIEQLVGINRRDLERVERETAIAAAGRQYAALEVARQSPRT